MVDVLLNLDLTKNAVYNLQDLEPDKANVVRSGICFGRMPKGTKSGNSTVMIIAKLPSGEHVVIETTLLLFGQAADVFRAADKDDDAARSKAAN